MNQLICRVCHKKYHITEYYSCDGGLAKDYYIICTKCTKKGLQNKKQPIVDSQIIIPNFNKDLNK